jgi:hypothetical protein
MLFRMRTLGTILPAPFHSLQLEALVERSCSACYKCPSTPPFSVVFSVFFRSFSVTLNSASCLLTTHSPGIFSLVWFADRLPDACRCRVLSQIFGQSIGQRAEELEF